MSAVSNVVPSSDEEAQRLAAVRRYDVLDTPPDGAFDRITAIAARLFSVPISIISLVDEDRIWFKSHHGLDVQQIDRAPGLCASAIMQADPWILTDAKADSRSLSNPLVAGEFGLRFYAGVPLRTHDGFNLGTLCVIDREPRTVSEDEIDNLRDLASVVMDQMELRLSARRAMSGFSEAAVEKEAELHRSDMMAKEIDHRVMNSLQLVSSLLAVQSRAVGDSGGAKQLSIAADRVSAIARAHQHIYMSDKVDTAVYLERLSADLSGMLRDESGGDILVEAIHAELPVAQVVPLGLILNELATNAAKHGSGRIKVSFEHSPSGNYCLSVSDEGTALAADFDPAKAPGLGMKVVHSLASQLGGKLVVNADRGAQFTVLFPVTPGKP